MNKLKFVSLVIGVICASTCTGAQLPSYDLVIHQRQFVQQTLELPGDTKVRIIIQNRDTLPAEFESYDLSREVVVPPGGSVQIYVGPLQPGEYQFFDDFNPDAKGLIVIKQPGKGE